jgi:predicted ATPase/DNA-binding CsgD family transcriptional regulator
MDELHGLLDPLTVREREILRLIASGFSNREIANELFLALGTVKWYNKRIFIKLAISSRAQAIVRARELGLLDIISAADSQHHPQVSKHNLPLANAPFVGRESELADLRKLFADPDIRLVTILGPGGMGKTRLALEAAAAQLTNFENGVYFISLSPLSSAGTIATTIGDAIGLQFYGGGDPEQQLLGYLHNKAMLLVLDNFEHLLDGGVHLVGDIFTHAAGVKMLVTSREKLNLYSEVAFAIEGMEFPDRETPADSHDYSAVKLFMQSARRVRRNFEVEEDDMTNVAQICRLVEGMPLGILLAASWVNVLSLEEIAEEISQGLDILQADMRDAPERHHSIRAVLARSWDMLSEQERRAFAIFSVFRGGCSRKAVQTITGVDLKTLQALVNKSLLRRDTKWRYEIHELLRQYAGEQLEASGEAGAARDAHCTYYLNTLYEREADLKGRRQLEALDDIESDIDNVRAAWSWAVNKKADTAIDGALESLFWFCHLRSRFQEGAECLRLAQEQFAPTSGEEPRRVWGRLLARWGQLQSQLPGGHEDARACVERSLEIARRNENQAEIAFCLLALGYANLPTRNYREALNCFEQSLDAYRELNDLYYIAHTLHRVGYGQIKFNHLENYMKFTGQSLDLARKIGSKVDAAWCLANLGSGAFAEGDLAGAERYTGEAIVLAGEMGSRAELGAAIVNRSLVAFVRGDFPSARGLAEQAMQIATDINVLVDIAYTLAVMSVISGVEGDYETAMWLCQEGRAMPSNPMNMFLSDWGLSIAAYGLGDWETARQCALSLLRSLLNRPWPGYVIWPLPVIALLLADEGQSERAAALLGLAFNYLPGATGWLEKWPLLSRLRVDLETAVGAEGYAAAWERGKALDIDRVIAELSVGFGSTLSRDEP